MVLLKVRIGAIAFRDHNRLFGPRNAEEWIVPPQPSGRSDVVDLGHLIENFGVVLQGQKTVRASFWHINHAPVFACKERGDPLPVCRRFKAQIENHVVDGTFGATHELRFLKRSRLIVHAAQGSFPSIVGNTALHQMRDQTMGVKFVPAPCAGKESSLVLLEFRLDFEYSSYFGWKKLHRIIFMLQAVQIDWATA